MYANTTWTNKKMTEIIHFLAKKIIKLSDFLLKIQGREQFLMKIF